MSFGSTWYPYADFGGNTSYGGGFSGGQPFYGSTAYEDLGGGLSGPRGDYFGAGYEPFGALDPMSTGPDGSMRYRSTRHGFGVDDRGAAFDIPPARELWLREVHDWGFDDDYRWPGIDSDEWDMGSSFQYLNSENPCGEGNMSARPPWHAARRVQPPDTWGDPMELLPAYGGEYGVLSMDDDVEYRRLEDEEYWR